MNRPSDIRGREVRSLLLNIIRQAESNSHRLPLRRRLARTLDISVSQVSRHLMRMHDEGLIIRDGHSYKERRKMLSDELANVADWITGYTKDDTPIPAQAAAKLANVLMDYAKRAQQMEIAPVRPAQDVY